ncbi:MAG TPA: 6-phosphogluconolactonase, partial [Myxococcota bacterium]|nr:6-phosphogluconolactonase [Myxococcota bacterium]
MALDDRITMRLFNFSSRSELFDFAANNFLELGINAIKDHKHFYVALSGGSTAQAFFKTLSTQKLPTELLESSNFFFSDERAVALSSNDSNAGNAWRLFLEPCKVSASLFFAPYDDEEQPKKAAYAYEQLIKDRLPKNVENIPVF